MDFNAILKMIMSIMAGAVILAVEYIWRHHIKPWLERKNLTDTAEIVVSAAEALLGRYAGEDKWKLAIQYMEDRGFDVKDDSVLQALMAAWQDLNLYQIGVGAKEIGEEPQPEIPTANENSTPPWDEEEYTYTEEV